MLGRAVAAVHEDDDALQVVDHYMAELAEHTEGLMHTHEAA
jgi:hypothetical protein